MSSYDAIVVGGSYAGRSAAMQLARARRRVGVVEGGVAARHVASREEARLRAVAEAL